ncbi:MAG: hypothetical protein JKY67_06990 [Pseudomonadales bacterium]|nr:hypothetical protein [Pseudomonadales bacterium]
MVELFNIIIKNKKVFYGLFISIMIAGILFAFVAPKKFLYSVVIEVGSYKLPDNNGVLGETSPIESTKRAKTKLEKHYVVEALQKYYFKNPDAALPQIKVEAPKDSNILIVATKGVDDDDSKIDLISDIADELVMDHLRLSKDILEQLQQKVELQVLTVEELRANLASEKQQILLLQQNLLMVDVEVELLDKQVSRSHEDIKVLTNHRSDYIADKTQPKEAMALLLIDNEIRQIREQRDRLEQKLYVSSVNDKGLIQKRIKDGNGDLAVTKKALDNALRTLGRIGGEGVISGGVGVSAETQLNLFLNHRATAVVVDAHRSLKSVGFRRVSMLALTLLFGVVSAVFGCFVLEFVLKVRASSVD